MVWMKTVVDKAWTEDRGQCPANVIAEGKTQGPGALVRHPVALCRERAAGDRVGEVLQAGGGLQRLCWNSLLIVS